ncbi:MAG: ATP-binding protein [Pseudomonadota bacterium]
MPIPRMLEPVAQKAARQYPVVTLTGPRQSGKTTLARMAFPHLEYISLEPLDRQQHVRSDPRGFLAEHRDGAILDEVQHVPELLGYLQEEVDLRPDPGRFVLTGSQHFGLGNAIAQSLAGRTAVLNLLPPSLDELTRFPGAPSELFDVLWMGAYPRIHDRGIPADRWLADYVTTYVQRDVRQVLQVADISSFTTLLTLAAGRTAQELNLSGLGGDAGVSHNTARAWLSVLEAGFLCFRLTPWLPNLRKRLVKAPKLHFFDTGLVCHLLGIASPAQLRTHPLRGAIFETWLASELTKARWHRGQAAHMHHLRETRGAEVDLVIERGTRVCLVEAKSGATLATDMFSHLHVLTAALPEGAEPILVHGGDGDRIGERQRVKVVPWRALHHVDWGDPAR